MSSSSYSPTSSSTYEQYCHHQDEILNWFDCTLTKYPLTILADSVGSGDAANWTLSHLVQQAQHFSAHIKSLLTTATDISTLTESEEEFLRYVAQNISSVVNNVLKVMDLRKQVYALIQTANNTHISKVAVDVENNAYYLQMMKDVYRHLLSCKLLVEKAVTTYPERFSVTSSIPIASKASSSMITTATAVHGGQVTSREETPISLFNCSSDTAVSIKWSLLCFLYDLKRTFHQQRELWWKVREEQLSTEVATLLNLLAIRQIETWQTQLQTQYTTFPLHSMKDVFLTLSQVLTREEQDVLSAAQEFFNILASITHACEAISMYYPDTHPVAMTATKPKLSLRELWVDRFDESESMLDVQQNYALESLRFLHVEFIELFNFFTDHPLPSSDNNDNNGNNDNSAPKQAMSCAAYYLHMFQQHFHSKESSVSFCFLAATWLESVSMLQAAEDRTLSKTLYVLRNKQRQLQQQGTVTDAVLNTLISADASYGVMCHHPALAACVVLDLWTQRSDLHVLEAVSVQHHWQTIFDLKQELHAAHPAVDWQESFWSPLSASFAQWSTQLNHHTTEVQADAIIHTNILSRLWHSDDQYPFTYEQLTKMNTAADILVVDWKAGLQLWQRHLLQLGIEVDVSTTTATAATWMGHLSVEQEQYLLQEFYQTLQKTTLLQSCIEPPTSRKDIFGVYNMIQAYDRIAKESVANDFVSLMQAFAIMDQTYESEGDSATFREGVQVFKESCIECCRLNPLPLKLSNTQAKHRFATIVDYFASHPLWYDVDMVEWMLALGGFLARSNKSPVAVASNGAAGGHAAKHPHKLPYYSHLQNAIISQHNVAVDIFLHAIGSQDIDYVYDVDQVTALQLAVQHDNFTAVEMLVTRGADLDRIAHVFTNHNNQMDDNMRKYLQDQYTAIQAVRSTLKASTSTSNPEGSKPAGKKKNKVAAASQTPAVSEPITPGAAIAQAKQAEEELLQLLSREAAAENSNNKQNKKGGNKKATKK